jgi:hypothetical protein
MTKARILSTIPGQGVNPNESILNPQLLFIGVFSMTISFLVSIQWGGFVTSSVDAVQDATKHRIPAPVSKLIAAITVTVVSILILCALYTWEQKVVTNATDEEA